MRTADDYKENFDNVGISWSFKYIYRQTFGENIDLDAPRGQYFVYILSTLFLNVVTLNLLISIISDTYDRVTMTQKATDSKQKLELLLQIEQMMKWNKGRKSKIPKKGKSSAKFYAEQKKIKDPRFLHILSFSQDDDAVNNGGDMWEGKIRVLRKSISDVQSSIQQLSTQVSNGQTDFNNEFAEVREQISEIKNEQKRAAFDIKSEVMNQIKLINDEVMTSLKPMHKILKRLDVPKKEGDAQD